MNNHLQGFARLFARVYDDIYYNNPRAITQLPSTKHQVDGSACIMFRVGLTMAFSLVGSEELVDNQVLDASLKLPENV